MAKRKISYTLSDNVVQTLIDPIFTKSIKNRQAIKDMMLCVFETYHLELVIELLHMKEKFVALSKGCYVEVLSPKSYWPGERYELDKLKEMGLLSPNSNPYAIVADDDGWDDSIFNPYERKMKVKLLLLNKEGKMEEESTTESIEVTSLKAVKQSEIKHFNAKSK